MWNLTKCELDMNQLLHLSALLLQCWLESCTVLQLSAAELIKIKKSNKVITHVNRNGVSRK